MGRDDGGRDAHHPAHHEVRATYHSLTEARSALIALERHGVDAAHIDLEGPGALQAELPVTNDEQRDADLALERRLEHRSVAGLLIGAVLGGGIVAGLAQLMSDGGGAWLGGLVAGAVFGGGLGFLWSSFAVLAVDEGFADTYAAPDDGPAVVVVHDEVDTDSVVATLRGTNPSSLMVA